MLLGKNGGAFPRGGAATVLRTTLTGFRFTRLTRLETALVEDLLQDVQ